MSRPCSGFDFSWSTSRENVSLKQYLQSWEQTVKIKVTCRKKSSQDSSYRKLDYSCRDWENHQEVLRTPGAADPALIVCADSSATRSLFTVQWHFYAHWFGLAAVCAVSVRWGRRGTVLLSLIHCGSLSLLQSIFLQ